MLHEKKRVRKGDSEFNVDVLSEDIWEAIFLLLPIRTFIRLKCVSKAWKNLISKAEAAGRVPVPGSGFFYIDVYDPYIGLAWKYGSLSENGGGDFNLSLEFLPCFSHKTFEMEKSCNGLMLCSSCQQHIDSCARCRSFADCPTATIIYYVCNPLTRTWIQLPERQKEFRHCHPAGVDLVEPDVVLLVDPPVTARNFKVIRLLLKDSGDEQMKFDIYSSETGQWDIVAFSAHGYVPARACFLSGQSYVYAKGVLYRSAVNYDAEEVGILGSDLEARKIYQIKLPNVSQQYRSTAAPCDNPSFLKEFDGDLYYVFEVLSEVVLVYKLVDRCSSTWDLCRRITLEDLVKQVQPLCNELFANWSFLLSAMSLDFDVYFVGAHREVTEDNIFENVQDFLEEGAMVFSYHVLSNRLDKFHDERDELRLNYLGSAVLDDLLFPLTPCPLNLFRR